MNHDAKRIKKKTLNYFIFSFINAYTSTLLSKKQGVKERFNKNNDDEGSGISFNLFHNTRAFPKRQKQPDL